MAYLTASDLREAVPELNDKGKFPDAMLDGYIAEFAEIVEDYRGVAYEARGAVDSFLIYEPTRWLRLSFPRIRSIASVTVTDPAVDGTTTTIDADDYTFDAKTGDLEYPAGFVAGSRVLVAYVHGLGARTVADGITTNTDATLTSATAAFSYEDLGEPVTGAGIPDGTTISSITSATSVELSANATATATGVTLTISAPQASVLRACRQYVRSCAMSDRSGVPRDVITQADGSGGYTRYSTADKSAGRPTGYLEVDRILNSLEDHRRLL